MDFWLMSFPLSNHFFVFVLGNFFLYHAVCKKTYHFLSLVKQHQTRLTVLKLPSVVYSKAALVHPNFFIIATRPMFVTFSEGWTLNSNGYFCLLSRSGELEACDTYQKMKIEPTLNMKTKIFKKHHACFVQI